MDQSKGKDKSPATTASPLSEGASERIIPGAPPAQDQEKESLDVWGFRDTVFRINSRGNVELTGERYNFSGIEMPALLPWISGIMDVDIRPEQTNPSSYPPDIPKAVANPEFLSEVREFLEEDQITLVCQLGWQRWLTNHYESASLHHGKYITLWRPIVTAPLDDGQPYPALVFWMLRLPLVLWLIPIKLTALLGLILTITPVTDFELSFH